MATPRAGLGELLPRSLRALLRRRRVLDLALRAACAAASLLVALRVRWPAGIRFDAFVWGAAESPPLGTRGWPRLPRFAGGALLLGIVPGFFYLLFHDVADLYGAVVDTLHEGKGCSPSTRSTSGRCPIATSTSSMGCFKISAKPGWERASATAPSRPCAASITRSGRWVPSRSTCSPSRVCAPGPRRSPPC